MQDCQEEKCIDGMETCLVAQCTPHLAHPHDESTRPDQREGLERHCGCSKLHGFDAPAYAYDELSYQSQHSQAHESDRSYTHRVEPWIIMVLRSFLLLGDVSEPWSIELELGINHHDQDIVDSIEASGTPNPRSG
jgi:hypothetical protein